MELTKRQLEIENLVIKGFKSKEIGELLGVKEKTVKFHLTKVYNKRNVKSRASLLAEKLKDKPVVEVTKTKAEIEAAMTETLKSLGILTDGAFSHKILTRLMENLGYEVLWT